MLSGNCKKDHEIRMIHRDHEIILTDENNVEFASLTVQTMTDEQEKPTNGFYVLFNTVEKKSFVEKNIAQVF